jgi:hypothetical protein
MKHKRQIGTVLINKLSARGDFIIFFYAEWSWASPLGLRVLCDLLSDDRLKDVDLCVIDIDNEFYNTVTAQLNLPMSHGWGEMYFFKSHRNMPPKMSSAGILTHPLATRLNEIYGKE